MPANIDKAERCVEAILFASGEPVEITRLCDALELDERTARSLVERIRERYLAQKSPLEIALLGDSCQMCALPEYSPIIRQALKLRRNTPLSQAAMEVLALVAYNQPVTRSFVEQVRGVDCSYVVRSLMDKGLIEEAGRLPIPGKPIAYRTTAVFLRSFSLESLAQLPELPEDAPEDENAPPDTYEEQIEGQLDFFDNDII